MATYILGDVQGCYRSLRQLLEIVRFDRNRDELWFAGDLVNRGPQSLEVLRYVCSLGDRARMVLGNHDVHLIQIFDGVRPLRPSDTFSDILSDPDSSSWVEWLRAQPLMHYSTRHKLCMVHAGIPPTWNLEIAMKMAREGEQWIREVRGEKLLRNNGEAPPADCFGLTERARIGLIFQSFTMMRLCDKSGRLDLQFKGVAKGASRPGFLPWFAHRHRALAELPIVFGHWSALNGNPNEPMLQALDTGCVWGKRLTALRLEDWKRFSCACHPEDQPASRERS